MALWAGVAVAQDNWRDAGMIDYTVGVRQLFADTVTNNLLAMGQITRVNDFGTPSILGYSNGTWNETVAARGWVYSAARWGDTLLIAGNLWQVDGVAVNKVGAFYNGSWHSFGIVGGDFANGSIWKLRVLDGTLYAVGSFDYADGHLCNGVAKRENGQWVNLGSFETDNGDPIFTDIISYHGDIYACGAVSLAPGGENGIIRYDGTSWTAPGGGILGGNAGGLCMAIYNDELVLGGTIHRSAGNPGHMIMRWNGEEWRGLGTHLRDQNNDTIGEARCYALLPYEDKLLVAGGFWYAGGVPASRFAIWDGERWCGTGDEWEGYGESLTIFDDTLFMASGYEVNGMPVNRIAKWVGGPIEGTVCSSPLGIVEEVCRLEPLIFPNPGSGNFVLRWPLHPGTSFDVIDPIGRLITTGRLDSGGESRLEFGTIASGLYTIEFTSRERVARTLRFLKE
ncbi:MAG: T9SS type A sorting domain-containing protein [Flavobacteriales bacterium]|nr:T9SS type A sorting domain-containing protein [Flavobacteriales bacterium]